MRWYFGIDEGGSRGEIGEMARLAVLSARAVGGLEPVLLYHGVRNEFCSWMERHGVRIVETFPPFWDEVLRQKAARGFGAHLPGHWLRVMIPKIETERDYVLYTDCDVIFLRRFAWERLTPRVFAAAPEFLPDDWTYFNSGVMLLNMAAMRATWTDFEAHILARIGDHSLAHYDDQLALNEAYAGHWERLPLICNHKPYWPFDATAAVLHFHGPKPEMMERLLRNPGADHGKAALYFQKMLDARLGCYTAWTRHLGDHLQTIDFDWALRFARLASALTVHGKALPETPRPFPPA